MKAFLLIASLSFASAVMLVPQHGNETRIGNYGTELPTNSTNTSTDFMNHSNFTNDINSKHRPHLAVVESRKLLEENSKYSDILDGAVILSIDGNKAKDMETVSSYLAKKENQKARYQIISKNGQMYSIIM